MSEGMSIDEIAKAMIENKAILTEALISQEDVTPQELLEYMSGETPTGDKTTISDVIMHRWLLLHELAELKHLKLRGFFISRRLVWDSYLDVLEAHIAATAVELKMATKHGDQEWVRSRVELIPSWLEDSDMPPELRSALLNLLEHYKR
ncbi:MAG: hypothetical protein P1Q69_00260 [Candidatus Thorarchaeota archaeon]|nr:hypothetical protein [Candidatus Thorarchaeota archaeon]